MQGCKTERTSTHQKQTIAQKQAMRFTKTSSLQFVLETGKTCTVLCSLKYRYISNKMTKVFRLLSFIQYYVPCNITWHQKN